jgi:hypothetical protein
MSTNEKDIEELKGWYAEFFAQHDDYLNKIQDTVNDRKFRLVMNINDIRAFDDDTANE